MSKDVPRGTATDTILYTAPPYEDVADLNRRRIAAGFAHIDRLSVDGGTFVEPKPIRRRYTLQVAGLVGIMICAVAVVVAIFGVM